MKHGQHRELDHLLPHEKGFKEGRNRNNGAVGQAERGPDTSAKGRRTGDLGRLAKDRDGMEKEKVNDLLFNHIDFLC